jgi:MFS transporter, putative metabolite:H+ symporter
MYELLDRQHRLTANQWKIIATANLGDMLDFFDFFLIGYVLAFIVGPWHLTFGGDGVGVIRSRRSARGLLLGLDG